MTLQEQLGKAIVQLRKQRGLAQEKFANDAEIDRRYMSDIENGKRNISIDVIERVANCLNIRVSELFSVAKNIDSYRTIDSLKDWLFDRDYEETVVLENPDYLSAIVGVSNDEVCEFIDFNTIGALPYMGEKRPVILNKIKD